jgi:hypothetical protein
MTWREPAWARKVPASQSPGAFFRQCVRPLRRSPRDADGFADAHKFALSPARHRIVTGGSHRRCSKALTEPGIVEPACAAALRRHRRDHSVRGRESRARLLGPVPRQRRIRGPPRADLQRQLGLRRLAPRLRLGQVTLNSAWSHKGKAALLPRRRGAGPAPCCWGKDKPEPHNKGPLRLEPTPAALASAATAAKGRGHEPPTRRFARRNSVVLKAYYSGLATAVPALQISPFPRTFR